MFSNHMGVVFEYKKKYFYSFHFICYSRLCGLDAKLERTEFEKAANVRVKATTFMNH